MELRADQLHRTVKLEMDEGRARTLEEAEALAAGYVLQLQIGAGAEQSPALQAAILTVVNTASRAFLGGVRVQIAADPMLNAGWAKNLHLSEAIESFGGIIVKEPSEEHLTLILGDPRTPVLGAITLYPTWEGWSGGVVEHPGERLQEDADCSLAAVLASALAVSEAFQHIRGNPEAGRRMIGLSLWRPELDWTDPESFGPEIHYLPSQAWILGLGHLGQAYCWCLGCLPYADPRQLLLYLVDFDIVEEANESTGLLVDRESVGQTKTRAVARRLEELGVQTRISERAFDSHTQRTADEPTLALAGFDDPVPRRDLEDANFERVIDAGLGAMAAHYNEMQVHAFPSGLRAHSAFRSQVQPTMRPDQDAYKDLVERRVEAGETHGEAECGVLEIAGRTVGAAFVGTVAGALVVAETLRILCRGPRYQVIDLSLRSPKYLEAIANEAPGPFVNPGHALAARPG